MNLKYHQPTLDLIHKASPIEVSPHKVLAAVCTAGNRALDEAVVEWFSLVQEYDILKQNTSYTHLQPIELLGSLVTIEGLAAEYQDLINSQKCIYLFEEELDGSPVKWFLAPDGSPDPKVLLHTPIFPDILMPHPHSFSKLIYLNVWDKQVEKPSANGFYIQATTGIFSEKYNLYLRSQLNSRVSTFFLYASRTIHRYYKKEVRLNVWANGIENTYWYGWAANFEELKKLITVLIEEFSFLKNHLTLATCPSDSAAAQKKNQFQQLIK